MWTFDTQDASKPLPRKCCSIYRTSFTNTLLNEYLLSVGDASTMSRRARPWHGSAGMGWRAVQPPHIAAGLLLLLLVNLPGNTAAWSPEKLSTSTHFPWTLSGTGARRFVHSLITTSLRLLLLVSWFIWQVTYFPRFLGWSQGPQAE